MSLHVAKLVKNPLVLAGTALFIHMGAAAAADSSGDAQQQARELLARTTIAHLAADPSVRDEKTTRRTGDAQQSARQMLLGLSGTHVEGAEATKRSEVAGAEATRQGRPGAHGDAQAAARQLLLGRPGAGDVSRLAARRTR